MIGRSHLPLSRLPLPRLLPHMFGFVWLIGLAVVFPSNYALAEPNWPQARELDPNRLATAGLRVVRSKHCTMVTDLPSSPSVDELPQVIDAAMKSWKAAFGLSSERLAPWRLRVYLIDDRSRFDAHRLMPVRDNFPHGFAYGYEVWLYEQPTKYYRRHLLLHEATHALMMTELGGCGPAWYMEGIAELYATHSWKSETESLQLATFPNHKKEAPHWGRVRLIQEALREQSIPSIEAFMKADNRVAMTVDTYAWLWALAKFLDKHPRYQERWQALSDQVLDPRFNTNFLAAYEPDRSELDQEWKLFLSRLCYGYDIEREAIKYAVERIESVASNGDPKLTVSVAANRGWQNSGYQVKAGRKYRLQAAGKCVIGREQQGDPWLSEAGGITLEYVDGRPLGELLGTIDDSQSNAFLRSEPIGVAGVLIPKRSGTLFLRLNDAPNQLRENVGAISVTISTDSVD